MVQAIREAKEESKYNMPSGKNICEMYTPLNPTVMYKTGICRVYLLFLFLIQIIHCSAH